MEKETKKKKDFKSKKEAVAVDTVDAVAVDTVEVVAVDTLEAVAVDTAVPSTISPGYLKKLLDNYSRYTLKKRGIIK